jgi:hypothetical protein
MTSTVTKIGDTAAGRAAAARRATKAYVAAINAKLKLRMGQLAAAHRIHWDWQMKTEFGNARLLKLAREDAEFGRLCREAAVAEEITKIMLEAGAWPVLGEPGEEVRWHRPDDPTRQGVLPLAEEGGST